VACVACGLRWWQGNEDRQCGAMCGLLWLLLAERGARGGGRTRTWSLRCLRQLLELLPQHVNALAQPRLLRAVLHICPRHQHGSTWKDDSCRARWRGQRHCCRRGIVTALCENLSVGVRAWSIPLGGALVLKRFPLRGARGLLPECPRKIENEGERDLPAQARAGSLQRRCLPMAPGGLGRR